MRACPKELVRKDLTGLTWSAAPASRVAASWVIMLLSSAAAEVTVWASSPPTMALRTTLNWFSTWETRSPEMADMTVFSKPSFS